MRSGLNKWFGISGIGVVALAASFTFFATGCASTSKCGGGAGMAKCKTKCKSNCAGKCKTPCKNADGTKKCAPDCKKPCCAKDAKKASAKSTGKMPCGMKAGKKGGCKPGCGKAGAKGAKNVASAAVNKNCPVSGRPIQAGVTTVSSGKTIGFCCGGCIGRWEALTSAQKDAKLAAAM